ncbi:MAG: hypothetical protein IJI53_08585 [Clostridia bacterium]|nr:hypothetical protein [Clostridia bacterium]
MKMKKLSALLLALCLIVSAYPALAAPTREARAVEVTVDEKLTMLTELVVNAAILQGTPAEPGTALTVPDFNRDETPSDLLVSCALAWGINAGYLPYDDEISGRETIALKKEQAEDLYGRVFTSAAYHFEYPSTENAESVKADEKYRTWFIRGELNMAFASACNYGVHIYSAEFDGTDVDVLCDVFTTTEPEMKQKADDVPEDALIWQCGARVSLREAPETAFGYTLNGFSFTPFYQDGDLSAWQEFENTEMEYSLNLPASLGVADDAADHRVWQSADGKVTLIIEAKDEETNYEEALAKYLAANPGSNIIQEREFDRFSVTTEGSYTLVIASEEMPRVYTITLTFPAERQAEYTFYGEIIRNSLNVWGVSNG